jgi:GcrA cell cycle regulator
VSSHDSPWTPELDERVLALHRQDLSYKEIGERVGMTKGQIAGRLFRLLGPVLQREDTKQIPAGSRGAGEGEAATARAPAKHPEAPMPRQAQGSAEPQLSPETAAGREGEVVAGASPDTAGDEVRQAAAETRTQLAAVFPGAARYRTCQWPEGEPGKPGFRFCGSVAARHSPYCLEHRARAFTARKVPA